MKPPPREIYVEGGGDQNPSLASECRKAFSKLFEAAGINPRPKVIVCGTRRRAYDSYCRALTANSSDVLLLVDAEDPLASGPPFEAATKPTPAGEYGKGSHSFKVLALVAPEKLRALSWADRFLRELRAP